MSRIRYDRSLSATAAATKFNKELEAAGRSPINLGQGRETERAPDAIFPKEGLPLVSSPEYNVMAARAVAAGWVERFMGIPATGDNTFIIQAPGRDGLGRALAFAATQVNPTAAGVYIPELHWPMYTDVVAGVRGTAIGTYGTPDAAGLTDVVNPTADGKALNPLAIIINSPQNPTGKIYSPEAMQGIANQIGVDNVDPINGKVSAILDVPYFYAASPTNDDEVHYLDCGYEALTKSDSPTPWFAVISLSKALGTANHGLTFIVVHPDYAKAFSRALTAGNGVGFSPELLKQVEKTFTPEFDETHLGHFAGLRDKYAINFESIKLYFDEDKIVDGDPGMTALLTLPDLMGKTVPSSEGEPWEINSVADFLEYMGNEHGVVAVDNGVDKEGRFLVRVALAQNPLKFQEGINAVRNAFDAAAEVPVAAARPTQGPATQEAAPAGTKGSS